MSSREIIAGLLNTFWGHDVSRSWDQEADNAAQVVFF